MMECQGRGALHQHGIVWCAFIDKGHGYKGIVLVRNMKRKRYKMETSEIIKAHVQETKSWWKSATYSFLKERKATKGTKPTHTSLVGGSFRVGPDDLEELYRCICTDFGKGIVTHLTERVGNRFFMFIDLDFEFSTAASLLPPVAEVERTVTKITGVPCMISTRTDWKVHVHCISLTVNKKEACSLARRIGSELSRIAPEIDWETAVDESVYSSGLRMLGQAKPHCTSSKVGKGYEYKPDPKRKKYDENGMEETTGMSWEELPRWYTIAGRELTPELLREVSILSGEEETDAEMETDGEMETEQARAVARRTKRRKVKEDGEAEDTIVTPGARGETEEGKMNLSFLNELLKTSVNWVCEGKAEPTDKRGYQVIPQCYECLVKPNKRHNSVGHSCLYINKKSVVKNCHSCGSKVVPTPTAKRIINQFNVIVLQTPGSEDNTYQELRNDLLEITGEQKLQRDAMGTVYKAVDGLSYAYVSYKSAKDFLNEIFKDDDRFSDHPNNIDKLEKYMRDYDSSKFPFLKPDRHYLGFANGVLKTTTCEFIEKDKVAPGLVVRKYFASELSDQATPLFDGILDYQFEEDVKDMLKSSIGRIFFEVGEFENWQYMPYLLGEAGTGKSTVMNIVRKMLNNVGAIGKTEDKYLLGSLYNKDAIVIDDVPRNIKNAFDQQTWQSCVSGGGPVAIRLMNQEAFPLESWKVPMMWGGNWNLEYDDKGQVSRRVLIWNFERLLRGGTGRATLEKEILRDELPALMLHCLRAYHAKVAKHEEELIYDWCPEYFTRTQDELREERNPLYRFLKERAEYSEGTKTLMEEVKVAFARFLGKPVSKNLDRGTFSQVEERWDFGRDNVCKSCKQLGGNGCCDEYNRNERRKEPVVVNLKLHK